MSKDEKSFTETKLVNTLKKIMNIQNLLIIYFLRSSFNSSQARKELLISKSINKNFSVSLCEILLKLWSTTMHFSLQHLRDCTSCFQMRQDELFYFSFLQKLHLMLKKSPTKHNEKPQKNPTHHICFTGPLYKTNLFSDDSFCCDDFTVVTITDFLI